MSSTIGWREQKKERISEPEDRKIEIIQSIQQKID